jgi:VWFA-related protein
MARLEGQANVSVDFVDNSHVLFTFNPKKLFKRLPDCPPTHDDRIIHAVIFEVPSGRVVRQADWYVHDNRRYLWPLGSGRFLLRRLNTLSIVDSDLYEKPLMTSPKGFLWLAVTPDGKQILIETTRDEQLSKKKDPAGSVPKLKVKIDFLDVETLAVQRTIKSDGIVNLEATSTGFTDVSHGMSGKIWLIRFGPNAQTRKDIARVRSRCIPDTFYPSSNTVLIGRCSATGSDYSVSAFTVTGHRLWRQRWSQHRYVPKISGSEDGSRFALSTLQRVMPVDFAKAGSTQPEDQDQDPDYESASQGLKQHIQIFDTATGVPVLSVDTTPAVLTAQNFSFAPDGSRLAMLGRSGLEIYDLPAMSADERSKYSAVKADVPGLYMPASEPKLSMATGDPDDSSFSTAEAITGPDTGSNDDQAKPAVNPDAAAGAKVSTATPNAASATASNIQKDDSDVSIPTFKTSTHVVVVDVVVTDHKGHPVTGLQQKDFQVAEDGKPQSVRSFDEIKTPLGAETAPATSAPEIASAAPPKLPANIYSNNSPAPEAHSSTIILLDLLNTPLPDQQRAREQLIDFLKKKPEASQMALCALGSRLSLIQGFTRDQSLLVGGVNGKKGGVQAPPRQSDSGLEISAKLARDLVAVAGNTAMGLMQRTQNSVDEQKAQDLDVRMRATVDAFEQLARYLSGIPGRKNLVWLSGSFPLNIFPNPDVTDYQPVTRDFTSEIKWATNLLAEAHVAVYPVSVKGLSTQSAFQASNNGEYLPRAYAGSQGPPNSGANPLTNTSDNQPLSSRMDQETRQFRESTAGEQGTMEQVAVDTGGKAFYNTNGLEAAIETAVDQGSHYYSVSYNPNNKNYDGRFRKIKVSLDQKGYQLTYRRGYYAVNPASTIPGKNDASHRIGVAAMQQGSPESHQIVFASRIVPVGKPRKADSAQLQLVSKKKSGVAGPVQMQHYGIDYAVDPAHLMFVPTSAGLYHDTLNFMVTAFNDDGRLMASLASTVVADLKPANYKDVMLGGFRLHQELDVPLDATSIRLGVEDEMTNHIGTLEIPLPVPVPPDVPKVAARSLPEIEPD